jgi:hypothetical protein
MRTYSGIALSLAMVSTVRSHRVQRKRLVAQKTGRMERCDARPLHCKSNSKAKLRRPTRPVILVLASEIICRSIARLNRESSQPPSLATARAIMGEDAESLSRMHEEAFVASFIVPERRERYLTKLRSKKHRPAFLNRLNHHFHRDLDDRFVVASPNSHRIPDTTLCYVIADETQFDGQLVTADVAEEMLNSATFGIVVSYVPGKLAIYKDEVPAGLVWLERK